MGAPTITRSGTTDSISETPVTPFLDVTIGHADAGAPATPPGPPPTRQ